MKKIFVLVIALTLSAGTPAVALDVLSDRDCKEIKRVISERIASVQTQEMLVIHYTKINDRDTNPSAKALSTRKVAAHKNMLANQLALLADYSTVYGHLCKD